MSPVRLLRAFTSLKTTAALLVLVAVLLFLNVAVPQAETSGEEAIAEMAAKSPIHHVFLVTLGMAHLSTSPVFLVVLGLFYLNLALVLGRRVRPTLAKMTQRPRAEKGLRAWARTDGALAAPLPDGWSAAHLVSTMRGFGYRVERAGERTFHGLKHRTAGLGFLLFHLSFFLVFGGGLLIYLTRFVGSAVLTEGQEFTGEYQQVARMPILDVTPRLRFRLEEVTPRLVEGQPVHLGARLRFLESNAVQEARVNYPAQWGPAKVLTNVAGITAVLTLRDARGFTLDRVAVPLGSQPDMLVTVPLGDGRYLVTVEPQLVDSSFPERDDLATHPITLSVIRQGNREEGIAADMLFDASLRPGEVAELDGDQLVLQEVRYWLTARVVSERGGGLLIAGFALGIVGLIWRLMLYRREIAVTWDDEPGDDEGGTPTLRLVGHSEYFPERFRDEIQAIWDVLQEPSSAAQDDSRNRNGGRT